jgi:hypothetical protein
MLGVAPRYFFLRVLYREEGKRPMELMGYIYTTIPRPPEKGGAQRRVREG